MILPRLEEGRSVVVVVVVVVVVYNCGSCSVRVAHCTWTPSSLWQKQHCDFNGKDSCHQAEQLGCDRVYVELGLNDSAQLWCQVVVDIVSMLSTVSWLGIWDVGAGQSGWYICQQIHFQWQKGFHFASSPCLVPPAVTEAEILHSSLLFSRICLCLLMRDRVWG